MAAARSRREAPGLRRAPLVFVVLTAVFINPVIRGLGVVVVDADRSDTSRALVEQVAASLNIVGRAGDLAVPRDADADFPGHQPATVVPDRFFLATRSNSRASAGCRLYRRISRSMASSALTGWARVCGRWRTIGVASGFWRSSISRSPRCQHSLSGEAGAWGSKSVTIIAVALVLKLFREQQKISTRAS